jgi:hypothetical protein
MQPARQPVDSSQSMESVCSASGSHLARAAYPAEKTDRRACRMGKWIERVQRSAYRGREVAAALAPTLRNREGPRLLVTGVPSAGSTESPKRGDCHDFAPRLVRIGPGCRAAGGGLLLPQIPRGLRAAVLWPGALLRRPGRGGPCATRSDLQLACPRLCRTLSAVAQRATPAC